MIRVTENEAYLLGILFGKGSIDPVGDGVILKFRVKFRRPTDQSLRADNIHTVLPERDYTESVNSRFMNDFSSIIRLLKDVWNINAIIDLPNSSSSRNWKMKEITITTEVISKAFLRLRELLNTDELDNTSLDKFPFHLNMENSRPISLAFIQGICDSCSLVPNEASNSHGSRGKPRIQLEPSQRRWELPIGLCRLFQIGLGIPVNNINWGHPQTRNKWRHQNHQFRVYLRNIPPQIELYRLEYKREEYHNLYDRSRIQYRQGKLCPYYKKVAKGSTVKLHRSDNADLNSDLLDDRLKGIDVNVDRKKSVCICQLLGCTQCKDYFKVEID